LLKDVTSGALRKKGFGVGARAMRDGTDGKGFELGDSDDDEDMIRRIKAKYEKYNRRTKDEMEDASIEQRYAANPETAAFAESLSVGFEDMKDYLEDQEEEGDEERRDESHLHEIDELVSNSHYINPHEIDSVCEM
jgi:hypothetical protein